MKRLLLAGLIACGLVLAGACGPEEPGPGVDTTFDQTDDTAGVPRGSVREGRRTIVIPLTTAVSQSSVLAWSYVPGYAFEFVKCEVYARTEAGVVSALVERDTVDVFTAVAPFATATRTNVTLRNGAPRQGGSTSAINVRFTTDGSGALTNGFVTCDIRPLGGG